MNNTTTLPWLADVTKACPVCGNIFTSAKWHNKKYCTLKCSRRAKHMRTLNKEYDRVNAGVTTSSQVVRQYFTNPIENPSVIQLDKMAELVKLEMTDGLPVLFTGVIPMWQVPEGILFAKQQKLDESTPDEWLMLHPAMIE